jgi:hypothetical protein
MLSTEPIMALGQVAEVLAECLGADVIGCANWAPVGVHARGKVVHWRRLSIVAVG